MSTFLQLGNGNTLPYMTTQIFGSCWHLYVGVVGLEEKSRNESRSRTRARTRTRTRLAYWATDAIITFFTWREWTTPHQAFKLDFLFLNLVFTKWFLHHVSVGDGRHERVNERMQPQDANTTSEVGLESLKEWNQVSDCCSSAPWTASVGFAWLRFVPASSNLIQLAAVSKG